MTRPLSRAGLMADDLFRSWINARELRLAHREHLRVCSFDWGIEALEDLPGFSASSGQSGLQVLRAANRYWLAHKDEFFAYQKPSQFHRLGSHLQFPSPVKSLYPENDIVDAEYFHCSRARKRAVIVLPHWNAIPGSYAGFCRFLNTLGFSALLLTLPYHGARKPKECDGAEYSVSPNIGRTIASARQGVIDTLSCLDWLATQGYAQFGIVGCSLGFGHAFVASAVDQRLNLNVFNHCCSTVSDAIWAGMPDYRLTFESHISQQELRECWSVINPISYFPEFARFPKKSLILVGRYDTTFARDYVEEAICPFVTLQLKHEIVELACGHRTIGDVPYLILSAYYIGRFLKKNFRGGLLAAPPKQNPEQSEG